VCVCVCVRPFSLQSCPSFFMAGTNSVNLPSHPSNLTISSAGFPMRAARFRNLNKVRVRRLKTILSVVQEVTRALIVN